MIGPCTARAWHVIGPSALGMPRWDSQRARSAGQAFKPKTSIASFQLVNVRPGVFDMISRFTLVLTL